MTSFTAMMSSQDNTNSKRDFSLWP